MSTPTQHPPRHLTAVVGQALAIELDALPGAGLQWQAPTPPAGCSLSAAGHHADSASPGDGGPVGGPARQRFVFSASVPGEQTLQFVLKRPWQADAQALQTVVVQVR